MIMAAGTDNKSAGHFVRVMAIIVLGDKIK
jgi:hypothetical protein